MYEIEDIQSELRGGDQWSTHKKIMHRKYVFQEKMASHAYFYEPLIKEALELAQSKPNYYTNYHLVETVINRNVLKTKHSKKTSIRKMVWLIGTLKQFKPYLKKDKKCPVRQKYIEKRPVCVFNEPEFWAKLLDQAYRQVVKYPLTLPAKSLAEHIRCLQPPEIRDKINAKTFKDRIVLDPRIKPLLRPKGIIGGLKCLRT